MTLNTELTTTKTLCAGCRLGLCAKARKTRQTTESSAVSPSRHTIGRSSAEQEIEQPRFSPIRMAKAE